MIKLNPRDSITKSKNNKEKWQKQTVKLMLKLLLKKKLVKRDLPSRPLFKRMKITTASLVSVTMKKTSKKDKS
jgi:predicted transcriptional regulator